ncbi:MAG: acyltransferase family protein [Chitinophagaceae bacterium]
MNKKIHFAGLDGLRFISIFFVVLHHLFTFKNYYGFHKFDIPHIGLMGYYGIQFFFAGSGFLITYLLLAEYKRNDKISLKHFYIRRILRIWPAYYLLIFLGLVVVLKSAFFRIPGLTDSYLAGNYKTGNLFFFTFLPHIAPFYSNTAPYVHQTYTIGIEEQFYFLWGIIFFLAAKHAKWIFCAILICVPILNWIHNWFYDFSLEGNGHGFKQYFLKLITYIKYCRFSTFAIGSLLAYAFFLKMKWINIFEKVSVQIIVYAVLAVSLIFDIRIPYFSDEYIAILMLCVFSISTFKNKSLINYDAKWLSFLGKISYGIYLFHIFAIVLAIKICTKLFQQDITSLWQMIILIIVTMIISVFLGWLSYFTIEKFFLRIKERFAKV